MQVHAAWLDEIQPISDLCICLSDPLRQSSPHCERATETEKHENGIYQVTTEVEPAQVCVKSTYYSEKEYLYQRKRWNQEFYFVIRSSRSSFSVRAKLSQYGRSSFTVRATKLFPSVSEFQGFRFERVFFFWESFLKNFTNSLKKKTFWVSTFFILRRKKNIYKKVVLSGGIIQPNFKFARALGSSCPMIDPDQRWYFIK